MEPETNETEARYWVANLDGSGDMCYQSFSSKENAVEWAGNLGNQALVFFGIFVKDMR